MEEYKIVGKQIVKKSHQDLINEAVIYDKDITSKALDLISQKIDKGTVQSQPTIKEVDNTSSCNIYANLDNYYKDFTEHRKAFKKVSNSSIKNYTASIKYLKYLADEDTIFTFNFFKKVQIKLQSMPKNFFKYSKYYNKNFEDLLELKEQENYEIMSNKTVNGHINNFRIFFDHLKYEEIIDENPVSGIYSLPISNGTIKEEYTHEEVIKILSADIESDYINMYKVALYCGLRLEEVLSIKKENIKDNFIYVDVEDSDTKKHQRIIPIHKNLQFAIEQQIKQNKGDYLFFYGNVGNEVSNVGKRINRRIKQEVPAKYKSFHSFRKNFSQEIELNTDAEEKVKKYLMGHSHNQDVTHLIYNRGKVNTGKLVNCINQITFEY